MLLLDPRERAEQGGLVGSQQIGTRRGDLFRRIGAAHAQQRIIAGHAVEQHIDQGRRLEHARDGLVRSADRAPVAAFEHLQ
ncbi:MAG: hypothetical protein IPL80_07975 [Sterolibacteriaceae bacterium]|nr:hypothetical protein [Sterolibacteriaceae bacterium]